MSLYPLFFLGMQLFILTQTSMADWNVNQVKAWARNYIPQFVSMWLLIHATNSAYLSEV